MRNVLILCTTLLLGACANPVEPDDRWARPEEIEYAPSLGVDLGQMNRTESGLYWQDLVVGTGAAGQTGQTVRVHYTGWLPDATMFDTSREGNMPIEFPLGGGIVIAGLDEGVVGMQVGGQRKLVIRPELAYKRQGVPGRVPPLTTVIFDVELMWIKP